MSYVKIEDLMDITNGGLEIIAMYYPEAPHALTTRDKKFKARGSEKTASASIRQKNNSWYYVTDFGGDQKERNGVEICMELDGRDFGEACAYLGGLFGVKGAQLDNTLHMPIISKRERLPEEVPGNYIFELKDFTLPELHRIGPEITDKIAKEFSFESLKSFTYIKEDGVTKTEATEDYPLYSFHHETWQKIYQPASIDKKFRFRYAGKKPKKFIHGLSLITKEFNKRKEEFEQEAQEEKEISTEFRKKKKDPRLDECFIVSGGSDGLNLRSFGYFPIWFNSESEQMDYKDYKDLMVMVKKVYYIADLDSTGVAQAIKVGMKFLEVKLLWLPDSLKKFRDRRGGPRKDFKDFVEVYYGAGGKEEKEKQIKFKNSLKKLVDIAVPMAFWDEKPMMKDGEYAGSKFEFKNTRAYHFLKHNGFSRFETINSKDGFVWIHKHEGIVRVVRSSDVKGFINNFLIERQMPEDLRDVVYKTSQLSEASLTNLPFTEIDFTDADKDVQNLFFKNESWKVTKEGIERVTYKDIQVVTWEEKIVDKNVRIQDPHFKIFKDEHGDYDVDIINKENQFLNYLINTSRVHWKKDLEESFDKNQQVKAEEYFKAHQFNIGAPNLSSDEILEQKLHLINKIYCLGYMLHKYKNPSKPWAPYAMDHKIADISESHGGSGKSIFLKSVQNILKKNHYVNGRDKKKTSDDFIYHGITEDTDYIIVDDCHAYMDYGFYYNAITGDLDVNNKNGLRYIIPFAKSPKIAFASNYPPNNLDPSLERRLLFTVFSDYYHYNKDGEYQQTRVVSDDFNGKSLFIDFDDAQWNTVLNFLAQCLSFYLGQTRKCDPPMENVMKRNLLKEMGEHFHSWADAFFSRVRDNGKLLNLDEYVSKIEAFNDFEKNTNVKKWSSNRFKKSLKSYAQYNEWVFNPKELATEGRIIKKVNGVSEEHFYIKTVKSQVVTPEPEEKEDDWFNQDSDASDLNY